METICVTGVPGTGKTTIAKKLAKKLNYYYVDVNKLISKYKLSEGYDRKRKTKIVDVEELNKFLINQIKQFKKNKKIKGVIIDSHLSHYLPKSYVDLCIVTKCSIKELNKRLKKKKFHKEKIKENLEAEIFDTCLNEALERKHKIFVVDTSKISKKFSGYSESKILKATKGFNMSYAAKKLGWLDVS